jgi:ATP-dependent helicase/nuclease subunit A
MALLAGAPNSLASGTFTIVCERCPTRRNDVQGLLKFMDTLKEKENLEIPDQAARDAARRRLDVNVVVEAGAGTGKTTLLTDRLLFLILAGGPDNRGIDVTRLVALTFTEKAAGEIKVRLSSKLSDLLAAAEGREIPDASRRQQAGRLLAEIRDHFGVSAARAREASSAALRDMDRASVGTIHHFAATLLRLYPLEAGVDPRFDVDDGARFEELFESEWALWLDAELGENAPRRNAWLDILPLVSLDDLAEFARELCAEEGSLDEVGTNDSIRKRLATLSREFAALPNGKPAPRSGSILDSIRLASDHLRSLGETRQNGPLPDSRSFAQFVKRSWPKAWEGKPGKELYERGLAVANAASPLSERVIRCCLDLIRPFADAFREKYARRGLVSFHGLLAKARSLVRDERDVREALKRRYDAILIDEFQDTDPLQGEILLYLAEAAGSFSRDWRSIRFAPGKIFVVGDPKQSIYRFRGADIQAFERFTRVLLDQGALKCHLQTNFRSRPELIAPINALFARAMRAEDGLQPEYVPLEPGPTEPASEHSSCGIQLVWVRPKDDESRIRAEESQRTEAEWIARWISANCAPTDGSGTVAGRKYRLKDVALLLRTTTPFSVYLDALKEAGIPYLVEADRRFFSVQEIVDFVNLLRALDDPRDEISLAGLLRSPAVGLTDPEILLMKQAGPLSYVRDAPPGLPPETRVHVDALFSSLRSLRDRVGKEPLGELMSHLLAETPLLETATTAYHGEQTLSNLLKLGRLAAESSDDKGTTLKEFIRGVVKSMDESVREGESPLADESVDAVRVLTIHRAKGLEYPVVFLPNLASPKSRGLEKPKKLVDWAEGTIGLRLGGRTADAAMAILEDKEAEREKRELVRLLYVAMTRAKEKLILLGKGDGKEDQSFSQLLRRASAWPAAEDFNGEAAFGSVSIPVECVAPSSGERPAVSRRTSVRPEPPLDLPRLADRWKERLASRDAAAARPLFVSPSSVPAQETPRRASGERPEKEPEWEAGALSEASLVGRVCHRVLERTDFRKEISPAEELDRACAELSVLHPSARWHRVRAESKEILSAFYGSPAWKELAGVEILGREIPFVSAGENGQVVRGVIDLLFRDNEGRLCVADYKSDRISAEDLPRLTERYAPQGSLYCRAVEKAMGEKCGFRLIFLRAGTEARVS